MKIIIGLNIVFVLSILPPTALGSKQIEPLDVRTACRDAVAGRYITLYSEIHYLKDFIAYLKQNTKKLEQEIIKTTQKYDKITEKVLKSDFNVSLEEKKLGYATRLDTIKTKLRNNNLTIGTMQQKHSKLTKEKDIFAQKINKVFSITNKKPRSLDSGKFIIEIEYYHKCRRFRFLCPLPRGQAKGLEQLVQTAFGLWGDSKEFIDCQRYSQILPKPAD